MLKTIIRSNNSNNTTTSMLSLEEQRRLLRQHQLLLQQQQQQGEGGGMELLGGATTSTVNAPSPSSTLLGLGNNLELEQRLRFLQQQLPLTVTSSINNTTTTTTTTNTTSSTAASSLAAQFPFLLPATAGSTGVAAAAAASSSYFPLVNAIHLGIAQQHQQQPLALLPHVQQRFLLQQQQQHQQLGDFYLQQATREQHRQNIAAALAAASNVSDVPNDFAAAMTASSSTLSTNAASATADAAAAAWSAAAAASARIAGGASASTSMGAAGAAAAAPWTVAASFPMDTASSAFFENERASASAAMAAKRPSGDRMLPTTTGNKTTVTKKHQVIKHGATSGTAGSAATATKSKMQSTAATIAARSKAAYAVTKDNKWLSVLEELKDYKKQFGNCIVPRGYAQNPRLASWVAEQRKQYKRFSDGKQSSITNERIRMLQSIGFSWNAQSAAWESHWSDLKAFREESGHCHAPLNHPLYPKLGLWVKEQRRHFTLLKQGKASHMTPFRIEKLNELDFCWDTHEATWQERLAELKLFREAYGHCQVPTHWDENPKLGTWVHHQRRQFKKHKDGKKCHISQARIACLQRLGFSWQCKQSRSKKTATTITGAAGGNNKHDDDDDSSSSASSSSSSSTSTVASIGISSND